MWEVNGTTKGPLTLVSSENDPNSSFIIVLTSNLLTLETYVYFTLLFGQTKNKFGIQIRSQSSISENIH